jgi:hypothetical protein
LQRNNESQYYEEVCEDARSCGRPSEKHCVLPNRQVRRYGESASLTEIIPRDELSVTSG